MNPKSSGPPPLPSSSLSDSAHVPSNLKLSFSRSSRSCFARSAAFNSACISSSLDE